MLIKQQKTEEIPHCSWINNVLLNNFNMLISIYVAYLENVVNICIINDLSYPPANNQNAFF